MLRRVREPAPELMFVNRDVDPLIEPCPCGRWPTDERLSGLFLKLMLKSRVGGIVLTRRSENRVFPLRSGISAVSGEGQRSAGGSGPVVELIEAGVAVSGGSAPAGR
ncbi:hypothetical protein EVAR_48515_1 [Eumeta japonica]|uniref:Uncharacterized protein n=1 Tax=Eumeta variegata TaxID=151549 RepID=A0A4C1Z6D7_EUMVA|nr:hypothetical protein EVAR_48515_1 [Eumeta japonica]